MDLILSTANVVYRKERNFTTIWLNCCWSFRENVAISFLHAKQRKRKLWSKLLYVQFYTNTNIHIQRTLTSDSVFLHGNYITVYLKILICGKIDFYNWSMVLTEHMTIADISTQPKPEMRAGIALRRSFLANIHKYIISSVIYLHTCAVFSLIIYFCY